MVLTPIIILQPPPPNPSTSDCETLLSYTNSVISDLESVLNRLCEVSSSPDEAMLLIRNKVEAMLSETKNMRSNLNSIKAGAVNYIYSHNQSQSTA